jgi:hypothetical protein
MATIFEEYEYRWQPAGGGRALVRKLVLPPSVGHRRAYEEGAKLGMRSLTTAEALNRRTDNPVAGKQPGQRLVWARDERRLRDGAPEMLVDTRPGRRPLLIPNLLRESPRTLQERADEHFAYGRDESEIPAPMPDYQAIIHDLFDIAARNYRGRHVYGPKTTGLLTKDG